MPILDRLFPRKTTALAISAAYGPVIDPANFPLASPWSSSDHLAQVFYEDVYGDLPPINTRSSAMRLPAVARARNLIVASGSRFRLIQKKLDQVITPSPAWTTNAGSATHQHRLIWTIDDLIFYGWSCHWRQNAAASDGGFPLATGRIPMGEWAINADNRVEVNGVVKADNEVILIPGIHEGILNYGVDTLTDAKRLYQIVRDRLANPVSGLDLHQTGGRELTDTEIDDLIQRFSDARNGKNAGVGYSSQWIEVNELGKDDDGKLMIESRNAMAVDLARMIGVTAGLVDATAPKASLNYETTEGRNEEFFDRDLAQYLLPIAWRYSMDDLSPRGHHVTYDLSDFTAPTRPATGPTLED